MPTIAEAFVAQGQDSVLFHGQNMTIAAGAMAETKTFGHLSQRVAMRRQSFNLPNMISILLRRLVRRLLCLMGLPRGFRPGMNGHIPLSFWQLWAGFDAPEHTIAKGGKQPFASAPVRVGLLESSAQTRVLAFRREMKPRRGIMRG